MEKYVVAYAKISTDKENIALQGVYFGGFGDTADEAASIAKECVNSVKGATVLPKVVKIVETHAVMDALLDAFEKFEQTVTYMIEANQIIHQTAERRRK